MPLQIIVYIRTHMRILEILVVLNEPFYEFVSFIDIEFHFKM